MKPTWLLAAAAALAAACHLPPPAAPAFAGQTREIAQMQPWQSLVDAERASRVPVVLRVRLARAEGGDKFAWDEVALVGVIKNETQAVFPDRFEIAHYSGEPGIPAGESTVYLERYNETSDALWRLLDGSGRQGVSHQGG